MLAAENSVENRVLRRLPGLTRFSAERCMEPPLVHAQGMQRPSNSHSLAFRLDFVDFIFHLRDHGCRFR